MPLMVFVFLYFSVKFRLTVLIRKTGRLMAGLFSPLDGFVL